MRFKAWIILSCYHWYKWDGSRETPTAMKCPTYDQQADVLDVVEIKS